MPDVYACQQLLALSLRFLWATGWCVSGKGEAGCGGGGVLGGASTSRNF